jgi:hypothetical protein
MFRKYARRNEKFVPPNDNHNIVSMFLPGIRDKQITSCGKTGQYLPFAHSKTGLVSVSLPSYAVPSQERVVSTNCFCFDRLSVALTITQLSVIQELPHRFPYQIDMNAGNPLGIGLLVR